MFFDERTEKNIATLHPKAQAAARQFMAKAVPAMKAAGIDVKIICGTRTYAEQDKLFAQGRTAPGRIVTKARGGFSNHNFGIAWDIGLFKGGAYLEESPYYRQLGSLGESVGLEWGGRWVSMPDEPHYQLRTGLTLAQLRERVAKGISVV